MNYDVPAPKRSIIDPTLTFPSLIRTSPAPPISGVGRKAGMRVKTTEKNVDCNEDDASGESLKPRSRRIKTLTEA